MTIRFDERVAIVTGAGQGLGRSHALGLADRGARVLVNDLGGSRDGTGSSSEAAEKVAEEIRERGGEAIANGADVTRFDEVEAMTRQAIDAWGRVDVLVNNAGILRDKTFLKAELEDFRAVVDVHLMGTVHCTKAVWGLMADRGYGRIAMTTSSTGLYGNFGQSNYGAAKLGVVGLMNSLVLEGRKLGIRVNCVAPCADTRMTAGLIPAAARELLKPEAVTAGLLYLVSEDSPNRTILTSGAGTFARAIVSETPGLHLKPEEWSPESVAAHWDEIGDPSGQSEYTDGFEQVKNFLAKAAANLGVKLG